jgi:hypothetical protein
MTKLYPSSEFFCEHLYDSFGLIFRTSSRWTAKELVTLTLNDERIMKGGF